MKDSWSLTSAVSVVFILLLLALDITEGCEKGFFGSECEYQCHCLDVNKCDRWTGACGNNKCSHGYFERDCQQRDSFALYSTNIWDELSDGDDNTCISERKVYVEQYKQTMPFSWMRIVFPNGTDANKVGEGMEVEMNNKPIQHEFRAMENTLDLYCKQGAVIEMKVFRLTFPEPVKICDLHTSYGVDLALKPKKVKFSSQLDKSTDNAKVPFDGKNRSDIIAGDSCFQTKEEKEPYLQVFFKSEARVLGLYIVKIDRNNFSDQKERSYIQNRFELETKDYNGAKVQKFTFDNDNNYGVQEYHIPILPSHGGYGRSTSAILRLLTEEQNALLTVCELHYFGEYFYNGKCLTNGHCRPDLICKDAVCQCLSKFMYDEKTDQCKMASYGEMCDESFGCQKTQVCLNKICTCEKHHRYDNATDYCSPPLTIGEKCEKTGFRSCTMPGMFCNSSGKCECKIQPKYPILLNEDCSQHCSPGYYRENCTQLCSLNCKNSVCHLQEGSCTEGCITGYFGEKCNLLCDASCPNQECDPGTGQCVGPMDTEFPVALTVFGVLLPVIGLACLLYKKRNRTPKTETQQPEDSQKPSGSQATETL